MKKILLFTSILFLTITTSLFAQHPTALFESNVTSTSVDLNWDASTCATSVNLRYRLVGGTWNPNINGAVSPYQLSGLLANTDYEWTVKCVGNSGWQISEFFTTALEGPTISNAFISQPILCNGGFATDEMQINVSQTSPVTIYKCIVGYYAAGTFFVSYDVTGLTSVTTLLRTGFLPNVDYFARIVDSAAYYIGNGGSGSGTSTIGIYDEFGPINFAEPAQLTATTSTVSSNLCFADCIASEDLLISGGTGPYSFTVNGGIPQNLASGVSTYSFVALCAGQYDIIVTDANGCSTAPSLTTFIIAPITIIAPNAGISLFNLNGYNVSCNGASDGIITAFATGGTGVFTYSNDGINFQSNDIFSGLSAGTHTITYKDSNGCIATETIILNEPPALSGTASVTLEVDCYDANTGAITFTVDPAQPGIPLYNYSVDNGLSYVSTEVFNDLMGDSLYTVIVKDNNGCMDTSIVYLAEPTQISYSTILSDYNSYEISCDGVSDGTIEFTSTIGGLFPYGYSIDGSGVFGIGTLFSSLDTGTYTIEVKDANGCIDSSEIVLNSPGVFSLSLVSDSIDCYGNCNATISITPSNGAGQILYDTSGVNANNTGIFAGLCGEISNGSYTFNAVDGNGCIADTTISIFEPIGFAYITDSIVEYCDLSDGQASITVTGGTGALSYIWNNNPLENSSIADSLLAGIYTVDVTDENNCSFSASVSVLTQEGFTISFTAISPCLGDSSGSATVSATGSGPYTYQWSNSDTIIETVITADAFSTIIGMPIGTYSVVVTDNTDCVISGSIDIISATNAITIDSLVVSNFSCYGNNDAQIEIFASGGLLPYTYSNEYGFITLAQDASVFGPLAPNIYTLQAFDANGCFNDTIVTLSYPDSLVIDSTAFTHITCFGADDGAVQNILFVGGTGPDFEFSIDGGTHQDWMLFSGLEPGQHTVEVWDVNNCVSSDYITIEEPDVLDVEITTSGWVFNSNSNSYSYQIQCNGDSSGYIDITSSGGTVPYLADSTTFLNTINIDSIWAGNHTFVVQDANGCTYQETILFEEPNPIEHNFIINHVLCESWNNGSVTDSVYGGVGSATTYLYLWGAGETTYSLDNLSAETYFITVTDENGCEDTESVIINSDNALNVTLGAPAVNVGCFDDCDGELSVTASGGVTIPLASYTYLWNDYLGQNTATAVGLCVDSINLFSFYDCIVTDAAGCADTLSLELVQPEELQVDVLITDPISCNGLADGKLKAIVTGGELAYAYTWSNGVTFNGGASSTISSLLSGIYKVTVKDANECRDTFEINLTEPDLLLISSIEEYDISCFEGNDGYIQVLASGGTSFEYKYLYTLYLEGEFDTSVTHIAGSDILQQDSLVFGSLVPGNYYVIAEDREGCTIRSLSVEITEPFEPLTIVVDAIDETCSSDGIIRIFAEGGSQSFYYFINGGDTIINNIIGDNAPGWYNITVIDTRGCEVNDSTYIKAYAPIFLPDTVTDLEYTICLGQSVNIDVEARPNLTYTWNDGVIGGDRVIKPEGIFPYGTTDGYTTVYVVTVTDLQGCEIQNTVTVHFDAIDPIIDSDPGVLYGEYSVVLEGANIDLFSNNTGNDIVYTWSWADNIVIDSVDNSITISGVLADVWYYLEIEDEDGCLGYDSIYVVAGIKAIGESNVYEAFTPNNDGFNDVWTPLNIGSYQNALVQVFNRWGGLVFESNGGTNYQAWDGTNEGEELAVGTYYYIIDLNTGDTPQTGPVTIIR